MQNIVGFSGVNISQNSCRVCFVVFTVSVLVGRYCAVLAPAADRDGRFVGDSLALGFH